MNKTSNLSKGQPGTPEEPHENKFTPLGGGLQPPPASHERSTRQGAHTRTNLRCRHSAQKEKAEGHLPLLFPTQLHRSTLPRGKVAKIRNRRIQTKGDYQGEHCDDSKQHSNFRKRHELYPRKETDTTRALQDKVDRNTKASQREPGECLPTGSKLCHEASSSLATNHSVTVVIQHEHSSG